MVTYICHTAKGSRKRGRKHGRRRGKAKKCRFGVAKSGKRKGQCLKHRRPRKSTYAYKKGEIPRGLM